MTENFGDADDGEIPGVDDDLASGGAHALAASAEKVKRRVGAGLRAVHPDLKGRRVIGD
jgi:hypothetical protein